MRRKSLSASPAAGVHQQSTIYIQDVSISPPFIGQTSSTVTFIYFRNDFSLVMSVVYQLRKIYGSKRPGYRLLIVDELQRLRYRSITSSSHIYLLVCILAVLSYGNKKYPSGGFVNCRGVSTCTWTRSVKVTLSSLHTPGGHSAVSWISPTPGLRV